MTHAVHFFSLVATCLWGAAGHLSWIWTAQRGTSFWDYAAAVNVDKSGNIVVTGDATGSLDNNTFAGSRDVFLMKFNTSGHWHWTRQHGSRDDEAMAMKLDSLGNILIAGETTSSLDGCVHAGSSDMFLMKFAEDGQWQWTQQRGTPRFDAAWALEIDDFDRSVVAGYSGGALDGNQHAGSSDIFVMVFDRSGDWLWTHQRGSEHWDYVRAMQLSGPDVILVGSTQGSLDNASFHGGHLWRFAFSALTRSSELSSWRMQPWGSGKGSWDTTWGDGGWDASWGEASWDGSWQGYEDEWWGAPYQESAQEGSWSMGKADGKGAAGETSAKAVPSPAFRPEDPPIRAKGAGGVIPKAFRGVTPGVTAHARVDGSSPSHTGPQTKELQPKKLQSLLETYQRKCEERRTAILEVSKAARLEREAKIEEKARQWAAEAQAAAAPKSLGTPPNAPAGVQPWQPKRSWEQGHGEVSGKGITNGMQAPNVKGTVKGQVVAPRVVPPPSQQTPSDAPLPADAQASTTVEPSRSGREQQLVQEQQELETRTEEQMARLVEQMQHLRQQVQTSQVAPAMLPQIQAQPGSLRELQQKVQQLQQQQEQLVRQWNTVNVQNPAAQQQIQNRYNLLQQEQQQLQREIEKLQAEAQEQQERPEEAQRQGAQEVLPMQQEEAAQPDDLLSQLMLGIQQQACYCFRLLKKLR
eukprot:g18450.t1